LTAAMRLPLGSAASAYGWMPQVGQKRCSMACLLKVQVLAASSGVRKTRSLRGTNRSNEPLREQIEQLQDKARMAGRLRRLAGSTPHHAATRLPSAH
jgi:hypothetical protein